MDIKQLPVQIPPVLPVLHRQPGAFHPAFQHFLGQRRLIQPIAEPPAQHLGKAGARGQDLEGIAVRQDDARIGIDLQQGLQGQQVTGRLEHPPLTGAAPLQMLQKLTVKLVYRPLILAVVPGPVGRHGIHGFEGVAAEIVAGNGNALLGQPGVNQVHRFKIRHQQIEPLQFPGRSGDAGVRSVGSLLRRRGRMHHFPNLGGPVGRVLGQQGVQERCAAAGQPGDEQRAADDLSRDGRAAPPIRHHPEPVAQQPHRVFVHADTSDKAELGLGFKGPEQDLQGFPKRVVSEIVQAGLGTGLVEQGRFIQPQEGEPIFRQRAAEGVDQTQEHRALGVVRLGLLHGRLGGRR